MGGSPKALLRFHGRTFLEHVIGAVSDAEISVTAVVVGHHRREITAAFPTQAFVTNPEYEKGMSTSVQAGIRALPPGIEGAGVFLVDQPCIDAGTILSVARELRPESIVLPTFRGRRGHPVFFAAELFGEILALPSDQGLNAVVRRIPSRVIEVQVSNETVLEDIDTPEQFENLLRRSR